MPWFTKKERRRQVSAFPAIFKADFGIFWLFPACFGRIGRFWPNQPSLARIEADSAWIEPRRRESEKKKKKTQTRTDTRATVSDTASHVEHGCGSSGAASVLSSLERTKVGALCTRHDLCCILKIYIYIYGVWHLIDQNLAYRSHARIYIMLWRCRGYFFFDK